MSESVKLGVLGAGGRMGQAVLDAIAADPRTQLAGAVERPGHPLCGQALPGGHLVCGNVLPVARSADALIDFTVPEALDESIRAALEGRAALVVGTTGLGPEHHAAIDRAARHVAVLQSANMSLGVNLLATLVEQAARRLGPDWDIEVLDLHHRHKTDAPSGTALMLGEAAARGRGATLAALRTPIRDGIGPARREGAIGFSAMRGGSSAGEHAVLLATEGERLELWHRAETRTIFARGALFAARWLVGRPPGRYTMAHALE
jgi:4-hydroxy-tetrahydrodipicolinate reductase